MPADFTIKAGDTNPVFTDTLTLSDGTVPQLTGATLVFVMRALTSTAALTLTGTATITNTQTGAVQFAPTAADTATPGMYMASWVVTFAAGGTMTFPTAGYLTVEIEANLTSEPQQLVGLADVKEYLGMNPSQRDRDHELIAMIEGMRPQVEHLTGPIVPQVFDERHDGGQYFIRLRRRPSSGYGTTPVLDLLGCSEYRGPIEYTLSVVGDPTRGSIYSCMLDAKLGTVTRRTSGGGVIAFPAQAQAVHVVYRAGQAQVPPNVRQACLEIVRINFRTTARAGRGYSAEADVEDVADRQAFMIPRRVREMLAPTRRGPSLA